MSNAEEIVAKYKQVSPHRLAGRNAMLVDRIEEYAQAHTNQTLDKLKEKVRNKSAHFPSTNSKYLTENDIITLIDEAINEK